MIEKSIYWSLGDQGLSLLSTLLISAVLARLIPPRDFGILAMIGTITGFLVIFQDFGFSSAIIYKAKPSKQELSTLFWCNIFTGSILALLLFMAAPFIAIFFEEEKLINVTRAMSLLFFLGSFGLVPSALISKYLDFKSFF